MNESLMLFRLPLRLCKFIATFEGSNQLHSLGDTLSERFLAAADTVERFEVTVGPCVLSGEWFRFPNCKSFRTTPRLRLWAFCPSRMARKQDRMPCLTDNHWPNEPPLRNQVH